MTHYAADAVDANGEPNYSHPLTSTWLDLPGAGASQGGAAGVGDPLARFDAKIITWSATSFATRKVAALGCFA